MPSFSAVFRSVFIKSVRYVYKVAERGLAHTLKRLPGNDFAGKRQAPRACRIFPLRPELLHVS